MNVISITETTQSDFEKGTLNKVVTSSVDADRLNNEQVYNLDTGLVAYWQFDGNANDSIGTNHGTVYGAKLAIGYTGVPNSAYEFDGVDDYVDCGNDSSLNPTEALTMSVWFKIEPNVLTDGTIKSIIDKNSYEQYQFRIWKKTQGLDFEFVTKHTNGTDYSYSDTYTSENGIYYEEDVWYFVTCVYNKLNGYKRIYVNGNLAREETVTNNGYPLSDWYLVTSTQSLYISSSTLSSYKFTPMIADDIRIYNRALTSDEIYKLYEGGYNNREIFVIDHPQFGMLDRQMLGDSVGIKAETVFYDNLNNIYTNYETISIPANTSTVLKILKNDTIYHKFNLVLGTTTGTFNLEYSIDEGKTYVSCSEGVTDNISFKNLMIKITATAATTISNTLNESGEIVEPAVYVSYQVI